VRTYVGRTMTKVNTSVSPSLFKRHSSVFVRGYSATEYIYIYILHFPNKCTKPIGVNHTNPPYTSLSLSLPCCVPPLIHHRHTSLPVVPTEIIPEEFILFVVDYIIIHYTVPLYTHTHTHTHKRAYVHTYLW